MYYCTRHTTCTYIRQITVQHITWLIEKCIIQFDISDGFIWSRKNVFLKERMLSFTSFE